MLLIELGRQPARGKGANGRSKGYWGVDPNSGFSGSDLVGTYKKY